MDTKANTRKVFKIGDSLAITLPYGFVVKSGLAKGDTVGVVYDNGIVAVVSLPKNKGDESIEKVR